MVALNNIYSSQALSSCDLKPKHKPIFFTETSGDHNLALADVMKCFSLFNVRSAAKRCLDNLWWWKFSSFARRGNLFKYEVVLTRVHVNLN